MTERSYYEPMRLYFFTTGWKSTTASGNAWCAPMPAPLAVHLQTSPPVTPTQPMSGSSPHIGLISLLPCPVTHNTSADCHVLFHHCSPFHVQPLPEVLAHKSQKNENHSEHHDGRNTNNHITTIVKPTKQHTVAISNPPSCHDRSPTPTAYIHRRTNIANPFLQVPTKTDTSTSHQHTPALRPTACWAPTHIPQALPASQPFLACSIDRIPSTSYHQRLLFIAHDS